MFFFKVTLWSLLAAIACSLAITVFLGVRMRMESQTYREAYVSFHRDAARWIARFLMALVVVVLVAESMSVGIFGVALTPLLRVHFGFVVFSLLLFPLTFWRLNGIRFRLHSLIAWPCATTLAGMAVTGAMLIDRLGS